MIDAGPKFYVVWFPTLYMTKVKITDLEFLYCNFLQFQFFLKAFNGFYSKIWRSTIPTPVHGLKGKVTDFEFFVFNLTVSISDILWLIWITFDINRYKILKCFIKEKRNCRRTFLSGNRSYLNFSIITAFIWFSIFFGFFTLGLINSFMSV